MPARTQLDLYIDVDVLTAGTTAEIVNAILEVLLYERNQIPFVYKTYQYYVNKWQQEGYDGQSFQVQRKKQEATNKKEAISTMKQRIRNIFQQKSIKTLRFLFGSTTLTAKEAYTLHIPTDNIESNHFHDHHRMSPDKLNKTLLSLLTNENLYAIFSHNLNPTNIYMQLELGNNNYELMSCANLGEKIDIFPIDFLPLPNSCKDIHINLLHKYGSDIKCEHLKCCKLLKVFDDLNSLSIKCENQTEKTSSNDKSKVKANLLPHWWEAAIVLRGFNNQPTKGCNIWC